MADKKPQIFIGSSGAGLPIATKAKACLESFGECFLWTDSGIWEPNRSTFDNLLRMASYFDFGVFVATADDLTLKKDDIVIEARDNVILEMALFLGAMGKDKAYLLVEEGIELPSDFKGIYMPRFERTDDASISAACGDYGSRIQEHYRMGHLSLYPTTALAIGYYKNFVAGLAESMHNAPVVELDGVTYSEFKLKVVLPNDLKGSIRDKARVFYRKHNLTESALQTPLRRHPAWFHLDPSQAPLGIIYDMPTTLTGVDDAIELILQKGYKGRSTMQQIIEQRELNNFRRVLQMQIDENPYSRGNVEIIDEF